MNNKKSLIKKLHFIQLIQAMKLCNDNQKYCRKKYHYKYK